MNKYTKRYKNFDEFCKEFHTVEDLMKWYKANKVEWPKEVPGKDGNDKPMAWPDEILKTKVGNCLDHAIFMHYFCVRNNIEHKLIFIQNFIESEYEYLCIGHAVGMYKTTNGINLFDIRGKGLTDRELGPYKSFDDAEKDYPHHYFKRVYFGTIFDSNLYSIKKKPFIVVLNSDELYGFDKYYNNYELSQSVILDAVILPFCVKKYGNRYLGTHSNIKHTFIDSMSHSVRKWISDNIGRPLFKLGLPNVESGLMGSTGGAVMGVYGRPFVSQIMSSTFVRPKYALHDDIFTDNILTTNDSDTLQMMSSDYLKDKKVRVFKYVGKNPKEKMKKLLESVGKEVNREYIYEEISGKDMINDEQIYIDEDFEEIKFDEVKASIENEAYTVLNKYMSTSPTLANKSSIVSSQEASFKLKGHSDSVVIMEQSGLGYYACNRQTMRRTKYYSSINDIVIGSDIDG